MRRATKIVQVVAFRVLAGLLKKFVASLAVQAEILGKAEIREVRCRTLVTARRVHQLVVCPDQDEGVGLGQILQTIDKELMPFLARQHALKLIGGFQGQGQDSFFRLVENEIDSLERALRSLGESDPEMFQFLVGGCDRVPVQIPDRQASGEDDHRDNRATEPSKTAIGLGLPLGVCERPHQPYFTLALTAAPIAGFKGGQRGKRQAIYFRLIRR
jgi:hypothetical protein